MKKSFFPFMMLLLASVFAAEANPVDVNTAREAATKFVNANTRVSLRGSNELQLATTYHINRGDAAFYVFNMSNGFVIVSADDCAIPILGYSDEGFPFDPDDVPVQMEEYLQGFVEQIQYGVESHIQPDEGTSQQWETVMTTGRLNDNRSTRTVEPLLTERWDQGCYYNAFCPEDNQGPCGHTYVGCAAAAMGQILHYWGYPATGSGSHSYTPSGYPQQSVNFWQTTYDWEHMPDQLSASSSNTEINAVATLLWHCGVSINMMYGHNGSGAYPSSVPSALTEYFNYSSDLFSQNKNDNASWLALVKSNLDLGRPIHYSGWNGSGGGGHSFVCDGYNSSDQLHFNWGWSGSGNGYFALGALIVSGNNFSYNNYAIFNIHPYEGSETYTIATQSSPADGGVTIGSGTYNYGSTATLTATPNENYLFVNWTKDGFQVSSNPTCHVTVRSEATYVANFRRTNIYNVVIGEEGTTNSEHLPLTASSPYSLTQQIYLANEINTDGPITDVSFYYSGSSEASFTINLYLKHTQKTSFSSETDWETVSPSDLCFSGSYYVDGTPGWKQITLDTPFNYNGTDNLLVSVDNNTNSIVEGISWAVLNGNGNKTLSVDGNSFNYNPYSPIGGNLQSQRNKITLVFQVTQGSDFVVTPEPIDFGIRPSGCWSEPLTIGVRNSGMTTYVNSIEVTNPYFQLNLDGLSFPLLCEYNDEFEIQLNAGEGNGPQNASLLINYGNNQTKLVQLNAMAYSPAVADVWETAYEVTSFPYIEDLNSVFRPFYNNYSLPFTDVADGPDAVYKFTITEESYLSAAVTSGENGKIALYPENFKGIGGPSVDNNFNNINQTSDWLYYVQRGGMFYTMGSNNYDFYWGVMYPVEMLQPYLYTWLTKVAIDEATNSYRMNTLNIYLGGDTAPGSLVLTKDFLPRGDGEVHEIELDEAIYIDGTQNLWITFHQVGDAYPAEYAPINGVPNSRWYSTNGVTWNIAEGSVTFPIHAYFTNRNVNNGAVVTHDSFVDMDLMPGTYYLVASSTSENWGVEIDKETIEGPEPPYNPIPANGATGINYDTIQFSWSFGAGTTEYKLMYGTSPYCEHTLVNWTDNLETCYTLITSLDWNKTYYWKIGERNNDCPNGITSPVWSFTTESFVPKQREITVEVYPSGGVVTGAGIYTDGQTCTLVATPSNGYVFKRWTESGMTISTNRTYSFSVHESKKLIAIFASTDNIVFANNNVKSKCVTAWDTNGDGELSYSEAADVTTLQNQFSYAQGITSFDELQYFTGLTTISGGFTGTGLTSITIPRFVSAMNQLMFFTTRSLGALSVVPENEWFDSRDNCNGIIRTATNQLEYGCINTIIPNTVTSIGSYVFMHSPIQSITIPEGVVSIGEDAFYGCSSLSTIVLPNTLVSIGNEAFVGSQALASIYIPAMVSSLGTDIFYGCSNLNAISVSPDNAIFDSRDNCNAIINKTNNSLVIACNTTFIPNMLTSIENNAFSACEARTEPIKIPRSITSIGDYAFESCSDVEAFILVSDTPPSLGNEPFRFVDMSEIPIIVPCGLTTLYQQSQGWCDLPYYQEGSPYEFEVVSSDPAMGDVVILQQPSCNDNTASIRAIPMVGCTFDGWTNNGDTVSTELEYTFAVETDCFLVANFSSVISWDDPIVFADTLVKSLCVSRWDSNGDGELSFNEAAAVGSIGEVFRSNENISSFDELQYFTSLGALGGFAFYGCKKLTSIIVPYNVTSIGNYAFFNCYALKSVQLPDELVSIGTGAFGCCHVLPSITIPKSVSNIGSDVFRNCKLLSTMIVDQGNEVFDSRDNSNTIIETSSNTLIYGCKNSVIPNTIVAISDKAFAYCDNLKTLLIPGSVVTIGTNAFLECMKLEAITLGSSITTIIGDAFQSCYALENISVLAQTPPIITGGNLAGVSFDNVTVFVPCGKTNTYMNAQGWNSFSNYQERNPYLLSLISAQPKYGVTTVIKNPTCESNEAVVFATPSPNAKFDYWTKDGVVVSTTAEYSFTIESDQYLVAHFSPVADWDQAIVFADANVKELCISNWDTDGDGELSYNEAAAVTSINTVFQNHTEITSFNELQFFVGLTEIPGRAFEYSRNIISVVIPNAVTDIGGRAFYSCGALKNVTLPVSLEEISFWAFNGPGQLTITSFASIPPLCSSNTFVSVNKNLPVYIPCGATEAYQNTEVWDQFTNYQETLPFRFSVVSADENKGTITVLQEPGCEEDAIIQATANEGYSFVNWTENGIVVSNASTYQFTVMSNRSLVANFVIQEGATFDIIATVNPSLGGTITGSGSYDYEETCTLTAIPNEGYAFARWREGSEIVSTDNIYSFQVTRNRILVADFTPLGGWPGTLSGVFSVSDSAQIHFSQGNLQYQASTNTWRFAENQLDYAGSGNNGLSQSYDGWIDLFGWSTSGYNHGANCYQPWSTSLNNSDYFAYGSSSYNLYDQTGQADWGFNPISNGGNTENIGWRTPTTDEWDYVFNLRTTASGIRFAKAKVNNVAGILLFPDNWDASSYTLSNPNSGSISYSTNTITASQWNIMEQQGVVFLPAAGWRGGSSANEVNSLGNYWSSSSYSNNFAFVVYFNNSRLGLQETSHDRKYGRSVRLVQTIHQTSTSYTIEATPNPADGGMVSGGGEYNEGTTCTLTATPSEGYTFVNWTKDGAVVSNNTSYSFTIAENATYVANFQISSYEITATVNPTSGGSVSGAGSYNHSASCTLVATPNTGYHFVNWSKDGTVVSTEETYSFEVTESTCYVANFELNNYDITVTALPTDGGTVTGAGAYDHGTTVTVTATANEDYYFRNWTENGVVVSTDMSYSFTVTDNRDLVANFYSDYHWNVDIYCCPFTMTIVGVIQINGVEQATEDIEIGAFSEGECRGRERLTSLYYSSFGHYYVFLNVHGNDGEEISFRLYDHSIGEEIDMACSTMIFSSNVTYGNLVNPYVFDFGPSAITQTTAFAGGWNWWSTYIDQNGIDGLTMLEEGLGDDGVTIKSQGDGFVQYMNYGGYAFWYGTLDHIANSQTYLVQTTASVQVEMTGAPVSPADCTITISQGWNWIGFPSTVPMDFETAFSGITPSNNDIVKSQNSFAQYMLYGDYGFWYGGLNSSTITPGMGLMYSSQNSESYTFTYPLTGRSIAVTESTDDRHWTNNVHAYPTNMTVLAVVELDDVELTSENFELAAFASGECRGSAKLMYVEPLNRYMAFLTVSGNEAAELHFGLYDAETGVESYESSDALVYTTDATVGSFDEPMVVSFRSTTGLDAIERDLQVYPNPMERGERFSINLPVGSKVRVDVVNALGAIISTKTSTKAPASFVAPSTAGVYTLRITVEGEGTYCRKLVVR